MIYQKQNLETKDGWLCVRYQSTLYDRPTIIMQWWPIAPANNFDREILAKMQGATEPDLMDSRNGGHYSFREAPYRWINLQLKDGGKTMPIAREERPLSQPKSRTQVRWHDGRWQKMLKSQGWVDLPVQWL
jgi:hypothetical protein